MIEVPIRVRSGSAGFGVRVRTKSIRMAMRLAGGRYAGCDVKAIFPVEPERSFAGEHIVVEGIGFGKHAEVGA